MAKPKEIYLSKMGQVFGPFDSSSIDELKARGALDNYLWICTNVNDGWRPLHQLPSLPEVSETPVRPELPELEEEKAFSGPLLEDTGMITRRNLTSRRVDEKALKQNAVILALCHNFRTILSGKLRDIGAEGCTLTQVSPASKTLPLIQRGAKIQLNLLNSKSQKSQNVEAKIYEAMKHQGFWDYRISWDKIPEILKGTF